MADNDMEEISSMGTCTTETKAGKRKRNFQRERNQNDFEARLVCPEEQIGRIDNKNRPDFPNSSESYRQCICTELTRGLYQYSYFCE